MTTRADDYTELAETFARLATAPPGMATRNCIDEIQSVFSRLAQRSISEDILAFDTPTDRDNTLPVPVVNQTVLVRSIPEIQRWDGASWLTLIS